MKTKRLKKQAAHKELGDTSGLGITAYFVMLFQSNELIAKKDKLTDIQIARRVAKEFPRRPTAQLEQFTGVDKKHTINSYRYRYNTGVFTRGIPPVNRSYRYNAQGNIVNEKTGNHRLLPQEIALLKESHKSKRRLYIRKKIKAL